jgi:hypothetical protein
MGHGLSRQPQPSRRAPPRGWPFRSRGLSENRRPFSPAGERLSSRAIVRRRPRPVSSRALSHVTEANKKLRPTRVSPHDSRRRFLRLCLVVAFRSAPGNATMVAHANRGIAGWLEEESTRTFRKAPLEKKRSRPAMGPAKRADTFRDEPDPDTTQKDVGRLPLGLESSRWPREAPESNYSEKGEVAWTTHVPSTLD